MEIETTKIAGVLLIKPRVFADRRGFFMETYRHERYAEAGIEAPFVQDNLSRSVQGTLRGMHFQVNYPQGKLINVIQGEVFDVAVDLRTDSPTFGQWVGAHLSEENKHQLYVPPGMAHGYCVLSESADFLYKCTEVYHPEDEEILKWNDPDVAIDWPIDNPILSDKDQHNAKPLSAFQGRASSTR
ncbi:dTDP-4-dehydrorhamnose 3,5-epimerase [Bremerella cremea]|uniref:dTDP-4-dehydrorhamnose 3,5-epimerase n=1 Tax=Bremerella cremea TaxID=1031537 RepID=UPI0031E5DEA3